MTTTGTLDPVPLADLGRVPGYAHPTTDYDLTQEFSLDELSNSSSLQDAIDSGYITVVDCMGMTITDVSKIGAGGTGGKVVNTYRVSSSGGDFTTLQAAIEHLGGLSSQTDGVRLVLDGGHYTISDTVVVDFGFPLRIEGSGSNNTFFDAADGLQTKPMFEIVSACDFSAVTFDGSTLTDWWLSDTAAFIYIETDDLYLEFTDFIMYEAATGICSHSNSEFFVFNFIIEKMRRVGIGINNENSSTGGSIDSEVGNFVDCGMAVNLYRADEADIFIDTCRFINGTSYQTTFNALSQTSRAWMGMCIQDRDIFVSVFGGSIYRQSWGTGNFVTLSQTNRNWAGMCALNNYVYAAVEGGDIYRRASDSTGFVGLGQTSMDWSGMAVANGNVYAEVYNGGIYMQTGGEGTFNSLSQTTRNWSGMCSRGTDVYACTYGGDIYKQTGGTGNFVALSQTSRNWTYMASDGNDVYAAVEGGDIYKQSGGTGAFEALDQETRAWSGMVCTDGGDVYAATLNGDIYKLQVYGYGVFYNPALFTNFSRFLLSGNDWNEIGTLFQGMDFTLQRDADIQIFGNAGESDYHATTQMEVDGNTTGTVCTNSNTWYKAELGSAVSYRNVKFGSSGNRLIYYPTKTGDLIFNVTLNVLSSLANRTLKVGIIKNGVTAATIGAFSARITASAVPWLLSFTFENIKVRRNDYFEIWLNCTSSGSTTFTVQDVNWLLRRI
jgi:hypothetical protein